LFDKRSEIIKGIPQFWLQALVNHDVLGELISDDDIEVLKSLDDVYVQDNADIGSGYVIKFKFGSNDFFTNEELVKTISVSKEGDLTVTNTKIDWKSGMDLCEKARKNREIIENGDSSLGKKRSLEELESTESIFEWFNDENQERELGDVVREEIWTHPLQFFAGLNLIDDDELEALMMGEGETGSE